MFRHLVRIVLPLIGRFLRLAGSLAVISLTSIFVGIPTSIDRIAESWSQQAGEAGVPATTLPALKSGARVIAVIALVLGWLILANLTIVLIRLLIY